MRAFPAIAVALVAITLGGACPFKYTAAVRRDAVAPAVLLKLQNAEAFKFYDIDKPLITLKEDKVELLINATKTMNGRSLLDPDLIGIVIDPCTMKVLESYFVSPFPEDAPVH